MQSIAPPPTQIVPAFKTLGATIGLIRFFPKDVANVFCNTAPHFTLDPEIVSDEGFGGQYG
jgi:hypothetical protein